MDSDAATAVTPTCGDSNMRLAGWSGVPLGFVPDPSKNKSGGEGGWRPRFNEHDVEEAKPIRPESWRPSIPIHGSRAPHHSDKPMEYWKPPA